MEARSSMIACQLACSFAAALIAAPVSCSAVRSADAQWAADALHLSFGPG